MFATHAGTLGRTPTSQRVPITSGRGYRACRRAPLQQMRGRFFPGCSARHLLVPPGSLMPAAKSEAPPDAALPSGARAARRGEGVRRAPSTGRRSAEGRSPGCSVLGAALSPAGCAVPPPPARPRRAAPAPAPLPRPRRPPAPPCGRTAHRARLRAEAAPGAPRRSAAAAPGTARSEKAPAERWSGAHGRAESAHRSGPLGGRSTEEQPRPRGKFAVRSLRIWQSPDPLHAAAVGLCESASAAASPGALRARSRGSLLEARPTLLPEAQPRRCPGCAARRSLRPGVPCPCASPASPAAPGSARPGW